VDGTVGVIVGAYVLEGVKEDGKNVEKIVGITVYVADGLAVANIVGIMGGEIELVGQNEIVAEGTAVGSTVDDENTVGAAVGANEVGFTHRGGLMGLQLPLEHTNPGLQQGLDALQPVL